MVTHTSVLANCQGILYAVNSSWDFRCPRCFRSHCKSAAQGEIRSKDNFGSKYIRTWGRVKRRSWKVQERYWFFFTSDFHCFYQISIEKVEEKASSYVFSVQWNLLFASWTNVVYVDGLQLELPEVFGHFQGRSSGFNSY